MKYKPERQDLNNDETFCHGDNLLDTHVDTIMQVAPYVRFIRPASPQEIRDNCIKK